MNESWCGPFYDVVLITVIKKKSLKRRMYLMHSACPGCFAQQSIYFSVFLLCVRYAYWVILCLLIYPTPLLWTSAFISNLKSLPSPSPIFLIKCLIIFHYWNLPSTLDAFSVDRRRLHRISTFLWIAFNSVLSHYACMCGVLVWL